MSGPRLLLCIKWGTMYGAAYVNRLYGMARRNVTGDLRFVCFTDDPSGVRDEVECLPLPELGCEIPADVPGKWPKQALWGRELRDEFGLEGVALYVDLDSVIVGSLDGYYEHGDPSGVYVARNWVRPLRRSAQTSVFRFEIGAHAYMLERLRADPAGVSRKHQMEQNYVTSGIEGGVRYWPEAWTRHFRLHCMGPWPVRYLRAPRLPKGAKVVTFPGRPKPEDALVGRWGPGTEFRPPGAQVRYALEQRKAGKGFLKHVKRYVKPTAWIGEHYYE